MFEKFVTFCSLLKEKAERSAYPESYILGFVTRLAFSCLIVLIVVATLLPEESLAQIISFVLLVVLGLLSCVSLLVFSFIFFTEDLTELVEKKRNQKDFKGDQLMSDITYHERKLAYLKKELADQE